MPNGTAKRTSALPVDPIGHTARADRVSAGGRVYEVIEAGPELLWGRPADGTHGEVLMAGELRGSISVADVTSTLAQLGLRGQLTIVQGAARRSFGLEQGALKSAFSNVPEERLGALMVSQGQVSQAQLEACLAKSKPGQRLGQLAVEEGLLDTHRLFELLQHQAKLAFQNGVVVDAGHYQFVRLPDEAGFDTPFNMHLPLQALLMESMQRIDEMHAFRKRVPDGSMRPVFNAHKRDLALPQSLQPIAELCDGERSVIEIGQAVQLDEFETTRRVYQLSQAGLLDMAAAHKPVESQCRHTIDQFNELLDEVHKALKVHAPEVDLMRPTRAWLRSSPFGRLLGESLGEDGRLDSERLMKALAAGNAQEYRLAQLLSGLHELASYTVFVASAHLPPHAEATLARETQKRLAALGG